ncbi:MAG: GNAT family N-acetyltransferase [Pseudomonadota bacterium]
MAEAASVLSQLRPQYSESGLRSQIDKQREAGYQVACARTAGRIIGVAGFVVCEKLAWGKHIYVDDLVVDETHRSSGAGGALISWLKAYGRELGCQELHLDSGVQRFAAHRFYLRHGFDITSHHFAACRL